jgi:tripartite-type tricarboxylate transporter receptor subunit TctC
MHYGTLSSGLVVKSDSPWKTLKEFVEYAKKNPGKVSYTSPGTGSPLHLAMEFIAKEEGIQWVHIPYTQGPGYVPLLGGHVTAASVGISPPIKAPTFRMLAAHGEKRMKLFPDVPTLRELGYDFINESVVMIAVAKGTPMPIVRKLDESFRKVLDDPEFIGQMEKLEIDINYRNPEDTKRYLEEASVRIGKMIQELKIPKEEEKK